MAARWWWPWPPCTASPKRCDKQSEERSTRDGGKVIWLTVVPHTRGTFAVTSGKPVGARRRIGCQRRLRPTQMRAAQAFRAEGMRNAVAVDRSQADPRWWPAPIFNRCLRGLSNVSRVCPKGVPGVVQGEAFLGGNLSYQSFTARIIITVHRTFVSGYEGPSIAVLRSVLVV